MAESTPQRDQASSGKVTIMVAERDAARQFGRLRKALNAGSERDPILYVTGEGYVFDETFGRE